MKVVSKISITETLRTLEVGKSITLNAAKTISYYTARSAIYRFNATKEYEFTICTKDNGCNYTITRIK